MSKPDLAAIRARHTKGLIQAWLPLEIVRVIEMDVPALLAYIGELENQLDEVRALVGPDNESGMISASAIFHTIGTGNKGDRR